MISPDEARKRLDPLSGLGGAFPRLCGIGPFPSLFLRAGHPGSNRRGPSREERRARRKMAAESRRRNRGR